MIHKKNIRFLLKIIIEANNVYLFGHVLFFFNNIFAEKNTTFFKFENIERTHRILISIVYILYI